jgi:hypothetical protein
VGDLYFVLHVRNHEAEKHNEASEPSHTLMQELVAALRPTGQLVNGTQATRQGVSSFMWLLRPFWLHKVRRGAQAIHPLQLPLTTIYTDTTYLLREFKSDFNKIDA